MIDIHFKVNKHLDTCHLLYIFLLGIRTVVRFTASEIEMHFLYYFGVFQPSSDKTRLISTIIIRQIVFKKIGQNMLNNLQQILKNMSFNLL